MITIFTSGRPICKVRGTPGRPGRRKVLLLRLLSHQADGLPVHLDHVRGPAEVAPGDAPRVPVETILVHLRLVTGIGVPEGRGPVDPAGLDADDRARLTDDVGAPDPPPLSGAFGPPGHGGPLARGPREGHGEVDVPAAVPRGVDRVRGRGVGHGRLAGRPLLHLRLGVRVGVGVRIGIRIRVGITFLLPAGAGGVGGLIHLGDLGLAAGQKKQGHLFSLH